MSRTANSFHRSRAKYKPQPKVLVLCEDTKSSLQYLKAAAHHFRSFADVEITHCGKNDPKGIINEGLARQKDKKTNYDFVYCVIDRDTHETFDVAQQIARQHSDKTKLIVSYPCYEYWLILHFQNSRKPYQQTGKFSAAEMVCKDLRQIPEMQDYGKDKDGAAIFSRLLPHINTARARAARLLQRANEEQEFNPSTEMHILITRFEELGQFQASEK